MRSCRIMLMKGFIFCFSGAIVRGRLSYPLQHIQLGLCFPVLYLLTRKALTIFSTVCGGHRQLVHEVTR
ncbi:hypothetical protein BDV24DRAFT_132248 [Aspergillus arachidicola]|uniref:Uncharacterized protein n=1 Tax=Aspergillus arachidicola TaxID=656916 RepID=A0A5N6Y7A8_9EURO|nr:hypothetical protein BDV24DRAFT_132248 [Aspergillus arachidicola]